MINIASQLILFLSVLILSNNPIYSQVYDETSFSTYEKPEELDLGFWLELQPHLLPKDHPIKPALDKLFSERITLTSETMGKAGFLTPKQRPSSHIVASKHSKLKGYLVKLYTDDFPVWEEWRYWLERIIGAKYTKEAIKELGYEAIFKVPKKWIYPLPDVPVPAGFHRKYFILVVEDMKLLKSHQNYNNWESVTMTPKRLKAYYDVIQKVGLEDAVYPFNVPFTREEGVQAFIDTERHHRWPVRFHKLNEYLSPKMLKYWLKLTNQNKAS